MFYSFIFFLLIANTLQLVNLASNRYLDSNGDGNVYANSGGIYQNWRIINDGAGYFYLQDVATSRFLDSNSNGDVSSNTGSGGDSKKWYFAENNIINKASGKYLDSNSNGEVFASASNSADSQKWKTIYLGMKNNFQVIYYF